MSGRSVKNFHKNGEPREYPRKPYILVSMMNIFAVDSMGLPLLVFYAIVFEINAKKSKHTWVKAEFNVKWPFRVIQGLVFWGWWKADEVIPLYNNVGFIS